MQGPDDGRGGDRTPATRILRAVARFTWDVFIGISIILLLVAVLFALSGVWPPFVAIESGSMEPHMSAGDLVFLVEPDRYTTYDGAGGTELVTLESGATIGHTAFGKAGHVVVFDTGSDEVPIIHRLHLWVEEGEDWYDRADPAYVGQAEDCAQLSNCPAPHAGFITKGDANEGYDQVNNNMDVIRPEWIEGRAAVRIPFLGNLRLSL